MDLRYWGRALRSSGRQPKLITTRRKIVTIREENMTINHINNVSTLARFGDYSPVTKAIGTGPLVAIAGQFGTDSEGNFPEGDDAAAQVRGAFANVRHALAAADLDFSNVLKFTTFLVGRETIHAFKNVRKEIFAEIYPDGNYPGNTLLLVEGLVEERFVAEIEA